MSSDKKDNVQDEGPAQAGSSPSLCSTVNLPSLQCTDPTVPVSEEDHQIISCKDAKILWRLAGLLDKMRQKSHPSASSV